MQKYMRGECFLQVKIWRKKGAITAADWQVCRGLVIVISGREDTVEEAQARGQAVLEALVGPIPAQ